MYFDLPGQERRRKKINETVIEKYKDDLVCGKLPETYGSLVRKFNEVKQYCSLGAAFWSTPEYAEYMEKLICGHESLEEFHTFLSFEFICSLMHHRRNMSQKTIEAMESYLKRNISVNCLDCWDFIGVNDNTPAMICAALILTGEYFGDAHCINAGEKRLDDLIETLCRREFISEFSSPSYSAITIEAVAAIAELSEVCKAKALRAEAMLWEQFLKTVYLPVSNMAGSFSRAYAEDKQALDTGARSLLYIVFGDMLPLAPKLPDALISSFTYHCPQDTALEFLNRKYPYSAFGTAETSSSYDSFLLAPIKGEAKGDYPIREANLTRTDTYDALLTDDCYEYPCGTSDISVYMTECFSLGTCSRDFHSGSQTDGFALHYTKNGAPAAVQEEIGAIYANYCINCGTSFVRDFGRKFAFQKDGNAMVLYSPTAAETEITDAKLSVYFSNYENLLNKITVNGKEITPTGEKQRFPLGNICIRTGKIYVHLLPLINEKDSDGAFTEITTDSGILVISFYNYCGQPKKYMAKELRAVTNGFVCNAEDSGNMSFEDFCKKYGKTSSEDRIICNVHTRYTMMREVKCRCGDVKLSCCISPVSSGIKYMHGERNDKIEY